MERFYLLAPALSLLTTFVGGLVVFALLWMSGKDMRGRNVKSNELFGPFFGHFLVWLISPLERLLLGRVSANAVTAMSLVLCAGSGIAAGLGHLAVACWLYAFAGILDVLDGRLARLSGAQTPAGALYDSVSDRWGEMFVFTGYAWLLRETPWMLAAIAAMGASQMVSYTRARAEGLGLDLRGGVMQRAERVVLVAGGSLVAAWFAAGAPSAHLALPTLGAFLSVCAVGSASTALTRWATAYRELRRRADMSVAVAAPAPVEPSPRATAPMGPFPVPQKLRDSAELASAAPRL